jgi:hypothetical protein
MPEASAEILRFQRVRAASPIQPGWHFALLYLATFGAYQIFWAYRAWKLVKEYSGVRVSVFWRALFTPVFIFSLARRVRAMAEERDIQNVHSAIGIAAGYWIACGLGNVPGTYGLLALLCGFSLWSLQGTLNDCWSSEDPRLKPRSSFTAGEIATLAIGGLVWILMLMPGTGA